MQPIKQIGEFAHDTCKLKRYYELTRELPAEPIIDRILPMFLMDDELSDFIDLLEDLKEEIAKELVDKQSQNNYPHAMNDQLDNLDNLIDRVIRQIEEDLSWGDRTAIAALLSFVPEENLLDFLAQ